MLMAHQGVGGGGGGGREPCPYTQYSEFWNGSIEMVKTSWYNFYLCSWGASARAVPSDRHEQGVAARANDVLREPRREYSGKTQSGENRAAKIERENGAGK